MAPALPTQHVVKVCGRELEDVRVLGFGGQGSVWLCKDRASGKLLARKTASASNDLSHEFHVVRFLMCRGVQDGIVCVRGMGFVKSGPRVGQNCLLLDFCNGGDLFHELKKQPECRLGDRQAADVVRSIAHALSRCHRVGIIHRDVKPENIYLRPSQNKKGDVEFLLADFGLARESKPGHLITDGRVAGTKQYMSPEMIQGAYDERADVWSLGMVLHVVLTGGFPSYVGDITQHQQVPGDDICSLRERILGMFPDQLDLEAFDIYSELSEGARSLLAGMLRKDPHSRFTMSQVMLHPWLQNQS